jgi:GT2 family glycosyltransferase
MKYRHKFNIMPDQPLFSILIVNYNYGNFLRDCVQSILSQDFDNYELLIVDGGSLDNSLDVISEFKNSISWWVSETDGGQSEAFNKGFNMAKGKYLMWVNADDVLLPGSLKASANYISKNPNCDWIVGNTIFFNFHGKIIKCSRGSKWNDFANRGCFIPVFGPSCIFRSSILHEVGGLDESLFYSMDTDLWVRFRLKGYKYHRLDRYIWGFRIHSKSKTSETHLGHRISKMQLEKKIIESRYCTDRLGSFRILYQRFLRLADYSFLFSIFDTLIYKGTNIKKFNK